MSMLDAFNIVNESKSFETVGEDFVSKGFETYDMQPVEPGVCLDRYDTYVERPRYNANMDGWLSPYASAHWGGTSDIMSALSNGAELGPLVEKIDPNKIFTADIAALRTLAADQQKIIKVFERKLLESLTDKGKFGLTEDDVAAMQALTSARAAVTAISKEQVGIKKNIAELKLKQQQAAGGGGPTVTTTGRTSAVDVGRSIMDNIFDSVTTIIPTQAQENVVANYPSAELDQAAAVLDDIVSMDDVAPVTKYEAENPTTYVVVGESDTDVEFVTKNSSGEIILDYPNPDSKITNVNRESKVAQDELMKTYPIIFKNEPDTSGDPAM